jgi:hypothetical protein
MDKDLFYKLFCRVSVHKFDSYEKNYLSRLPLLLLDAALVSAPEIKMCTGFDDLLDHLSNDLISHQIWKNSELYPYLNYLAFPNNEKRQLCVNSMLVHCGLRPLKYETNPEVLYWRLSNESQVVAYFQNQIITNKHKLGWTAKINNEEIRVFRPYPNLFNDVEPRLYGSQISKLSNEDMNRLLQEAFEVINCYSSPLCNRIIRHLSTVALLRESHSRPVSFSLRNLYIGVIFISIASPVEMAEQIIHEYYHQCLWPWWLVEPPGDLADTKVQILSPVSGATRSLPTMIQAVLIYASLIDFYEFVKDTQLCNLHAAMQQRWLERSSSLTENFDTLVDSMTSKLQTMPSSLSLLNNIIEVQKNI